MKLLILLVTALVGLTSCSKANEADFETFVHILGSANEKQQYQKVTNLFPKNYIQAEKYLYKTPDTSETDILEQNVSHFINTYLQNKSVIEFKDEAFLLEDGVYTWLRYAEYEGYEGDFHELSATFVYTDEGFKIEPHFTHPSSEQLKELVKLDRIYSLYFSRGNVSSFDVFVNERKVEIIDSTVNTIQLLDAQKGQNKIHFVFKKSKQDKPITFSASVVFVDRDDEAKEVKPSSIIHLIGEAVMFDPIWNGVAPTDESRVKLDTSEIELVTSFN